MSWSLYRPNLSAYFSSSFLENESSSLREITKGDHYFKNPPNTGEPIILLSDTHLDLSDIPAPLWPQIELIVHANSGYDNFSRDFVNECNAPIIVGNTIRAQAVAQAKFAAFTNHFMLPEFVESWDPKRSWSRSLLAEKNALIIGHGHIGKVLESYLRPFGITIDIIDPPLGKTPGHKRMYDAIFVCCGLNSTSRNMINKRFCKETMRPGSVLINYARGKITHQNELFEFAKERPDCAFYLDVYNSEPFETQNFLHYNNIHKTSHIAGVHDKLERDVLNFEIDVIKKFTTMPLAEFRNEYSGLDLINRIQNGVLL